MDSAYTLLHEAVAAPTQDVMSEVAAMPPSELLSNEVTQTMVQGYEYTRQDGTVEHAVNREEAIKLCPVLGKLAMQDPEVVDLLLDIASIGQAKMAEKVERPDPEASERTELIEKPERRVEQTLRSSEKASGALETEAVPTANAVRWERQPYEAAVLEAVVSADEKPIVKSEKVVASQIKPEPRGPLRHSRAAEGHLVYEQQIYEAEQGIVPVEVATPVGLLEPQPDFAEPVRQPRVHEAFNIRRVEPVSWVGSPDKELLQTYEDFSEALQSLIIPPSEQAVRKIEPISAYEGELTDTDETYKVEALPAIVVTVSTLLTELAAEDRATVAPTLGDIVKTVHVIETLKSEDAESDAMGTVQMELERLVIALFEQLGIEYEVEDVEEFVAVLLRPIPQSEAMECAVVDLEHDGTHEAKTQVTSTATSFITDVENGLERLLGTFALLSALVRQAA